MLGAEKWLGFQLNYEIATLAAYVYMPPLTIFLALLLPPS